MTEPDKTIVLRLPPALTVRTAPAPTPRPRTEIMSAPRADYWPLIAQAGRMEAAGEIRRLRRNPVWSHERQAWEIPVRRLKEHRPAPAWRKPLVVAALIAIPMIALAAAGWWLVNALSEPALLTFLGVAGAAFLALLWSGRRRGGGTVTATAVAIASVTVKR